MTMKESAMPKTEKPTMQNIENGFLKIDFRKNRESARYADYYKKAARLLAAWNVKKAAMIIERIKRCRFNGCYEYRLLYDKFLVRRNAPGDSIKALKDLCLLSRLLKRRERNYALLSPRMVKYVLRFRAEVYEKLANCLYYMGHDARSLRVYRELILFAERHSLQIKNLKDVKNKVMSLEFMLSSRGFRRAEIHVWHGRFVKALDIVDKAIASFGIGYLDHGALTVAAICNVEAGRYQRAKSLICRDYQYSPGCLETRFFYALMNMFGARSGASRRIIRRIANGDVQSSCAIGAAKRCRIWAVANVVNISKRCGRIRMVTIGLDKVVYIAARELLHIGIWFVEVGDCYASRKTNSSCMEAFKELMIKYSKMSKKRKGKGRV